MTEAEARAWLEREDGFAPDALARLERLVQLVEAESRLQNLVAASTLEAMWSRHIVDSAQLLGFAADRSGLWVDLGSGGGFPGLVIGCLRAAPLLLVEMRPLRGRFLSHCVDELGLPHVRVHVGKVEGLRLNEPAAVLSARAFAPLVRTVALARHLADANSLWLLPKGRSAQLELASVDREWQAVFHVEHSVTDPDSAILIGSGVGTRADRSPLSSGKRGMGRP